MTFRSLVLPLIALALLSACEPLPPGAGSGPGGPGRPTAELQIAGQGTVRLNGFPADYGDQVRSGDSVEAGAGASALIAFNDGTRVQLDERSGPIDLRWGGRELEIRVHGSLLDVVKGAAFGVVKVFTDLAEAYVYSHFVLEMERGRFVRIDMFDGRLELVRPASPRTVFRGEFVQVRRGLAQPEFGRTPPSYARSLLGRFDRWEFTYVRPFQPKPPIQCPAGTFWTGERCAPARTPARTPDCPDGQRWDPIEQICACPPELPHFQNGQCITCIGGMVWTGRQCECPDGTRWDGSECRPQIRRVPQQTFQRPIQPLIQVPEIVCPRGQVWSAEAKSCINIVQ